MKNSLHYFYGGKIMKKKILLILLVVCVALTSLVGLVACKKSQTKITMVNLDVYMENDYYLGTETKGSDKFDLSSVFTGATNFAYDGDEITLSGTTATVVGEGEGKLTFTQDGATVEKNLFVVEGRNVSTEDELRQALNVDKKNVVLQADIKTTKKESFMTYGKVYGNGHVVDSTDTSVPGGADVFTAQGPDMSLWIQDLRIIGVRKEEGAEIILEDFASRGALISIVSDKVGASGDYLPSYIKNCVLENGHKLINLYGANVTIEGCILHNSSDALIASGTDHRKGSTVTLKNNVLATSIVCGYLFYGYNGEKGNEGKPECQQTLNIEGFLDIYNWKSTNGITLMPPNETLASTVNKMVRDQITDPKFSKYLKTGSDGNKYVHAAIIVLASNSKVIQTPTINGADSIGYTKKDFPIPAWAKRIAAHTCDLWAYDESKNVSEYAVQPTDQLENDLEMFKELRYGRTAA